jgi:hypothetical protein
MITLGHLITLLKHVEDREVPIEFDFPSSNIPTTLASYRGYYSQLALGHRDFNYDKPAIPNVNTVIEELESAIGQTFQGWKGGDYVMSPDTPIWVDNPGRYSSIAITGIKDLTWKVILKTSYTDA